MFAIKSRMAFAIRALLIAVIFFNALMINPAPVQAEQEIVSTKVGQLETRSIPTFPTFERPEERTTGQDEHPADAPVFSRYQMIAPTIYNLNILLMHPCLLRNSSNLGPAVQMKGYAWQPITFPPVM